MWRDRLVVDRTWSGEASGPMSTSAAEDRLAPRKRSLTLLAADEVDDTVILSEAVRWA